MYSTRALNTPKRPNILLILTDEERYQVPEETPELMKFRETYLPTRKELADKGLTFHQHYTAATACSPSRASLFTGHYPSLTDLSETYGFAKTADDPRIHWLEHDTVPTMGHYFRAGGYETVYKGKWHLSKAELLDENKEPIDSTLEDGTRLPEVEEMYLDTQPLEPFGFSDWIGPEPHGASMTNSGLARDFGFASQVTEYLDEREKRIADGQEVKPFLMVTSLVNPHDVALFPRLKVLGAKLCDETIPRIPEGPSDNEDLSTKPSPQKTYVDVFQELYCPRDAHQEIFQSKEEMRQLYYYLHKLVDNDIKIIYDKLKETSFYEDTIVVFTSDHGDMLGAHGGMLQKWTVAYQEAIHIPLIITAPNRLPQGDFHFPTSAVDILPTLLGLAGLDVADLNRQLVHTHSEVHPFVGNDFSQVVLGEFPPSTQEGNIVYFMTEDEVTKGNSQISFVGEVEYDAIDGPCSLETIICNVYNRFNGKMELWKCTRYFDNPDKWSHPRKKDLRMLRQGPLRGQIRVRKEKYADEFELYNLTRDPSELKNFAHPLVTKQLNPVEKEQINQVFLLMRKRLQRVSKERRLTRNNPKPLVEVSPTHVVQSKM